MTKLGWTLSGVSSMLLAALACSGGDGLVTGGASGGASAASGGANSGGAASSGGGAGGGPIGTGGVGVGGGAETGGTAAGGAGTGETGGTASGGSDGTLPWLTVNGSQIQKADGTKVVLRGVSMIDLGSVEEQEGGHQAMIDRITDRADDAGTSPGWYPTVIRVPVYPADSTSHTSPRTFQPGSDDFYDSVLRPTVDAINAAGAYAIIDWHYIDDTTGHLDTTDEFWQYMAPKFKDDPGVIFELYNEPINGGDWTEVGMHMQRWYDIVHLSAATNLVLVGTPSWCQQVGDTAAAPISGTNIAYVAHMYPMHWASTALRDEITQAAAVHPVFITEWGFQAGSDDVVDGTVQSYGAPFRTFVDDLGLSSVAWVAHYSWFPSMFDTDWNALVGDGYMGGFAKDWIYETADDFPPL